jgi:DNA segregation ATPase FtsK/SpoIIIE-like protein
VKENLINYEIEIYDSKNELYHLHDLIKINTDSDVNNYLNTLITEIDQKLETINKSGVTTIDEYNKKLEIDGNTALKLKRKFIIINHLDCDKETYSYFENKLMYVTQLGEKAGVSVLYTIRDDLYITSIVLSLFQNKLVFKLDTSYFSSKVMNNDNATFLQSLGDCFYLSQVKARRLQTPLVSKKDIESINEYLK